MAAQTAQSRFEYYRDLIQVLVAKDFKVRYKSTILGYLWSILHPLMFAGVYFILFKIVMRANIDNYSLFLICGVFPWTAFNNTVNASNMCFIGNAPLIKQLQFPRLYLVLTGALTEIIHFILTIPVILAFMAYFHTSPGWLWLIMIPVLLIIQFVFTMGFAMFLATLNLFFRDLERLTNILTMMWFFLTPILFPLSMVPERWQWTTYINPAGGLMISWREMFMYSRIDWMMLLSAASWAGFSVIVGYLVFRKLQWRFAEIV